MPARLIDMQLRAAEGMQAEEMEAITGRRVLAKPKTVADATRAWMQTAMNIEKELKGLPIA